MSDNYYGYSENTDTTSTEYTTGAENASTSVPPKKKHRKNGSGGVKKFFTLIGGAVVFGLVAGLVFWGVASVTVLNKTEQISSAADTARKTRLGRFPRVPLTG